jgi:eukaryotic-like serine/threonine-protein kinase
MVWSILKGSFVTLLGALLLTALFVAGFLVVMQRGPEETVVPDLAGLPLEKARGIADAQGLPIEVRGRAYSATVPEGCICEMRPYKDKRVKAGRKIEVTLSRGPKDVSVPDLKGVDLANARDTVTGAKLRVGQVLHKRSDKIPEEVLAQTPEPGASVPRDSEVTLTVSGGSDYGELDTADDKRTVFRKVEVTVPKGEAMQTVKVEKVDGEHRSLEYSRVHSPGEKVTVDVQGHEGARIVVSVGETIAYEGTL